MTTRRTLAAHPERWTAFAPTTYAAATGACRRCGRELTDAQSIKAGIGPDCLALEAEATAFAAAWPTRKLVRDTRTGDEGTVLGIDVSKRRVWVTFGWYKQWLPVERVAAVGEAREAA